MLSSGKTSNEPEEALIMVCLSDTHGLHREIEVPKGDVLLHAGDFTMFGRNASAITEFNEWLGSLPHRHKLVTYGNHEIVLEANPSLRQLFTNAIVLLNQSVEVLGLKIWGSPTTPLYGGAFGMSLASDRKRLYDSIPEDTDVLLTHGPPYSILDGAPNTAQHSGCPLLLEAVQRIRPKVHFFGHVHSGHGMRDSEHTLFVNAAMLGGDGDLAYPPTVIRLPRRNK